MIYTIFDINKVPMSSRGLASTRTYEISKRLKKMPCDVIKPSIMHSVTLWNSSLRDPSTQVHSVIPKHGLGQVILRGAKITV